MGMGYSIICSNPECGYSESVCSGHGFLFPAVYNETVQKAKDGLISEAHAQFFREHPDGAVNAEEKIYECRKCAHLFSEPSLDMYIPKKDETGAPLEGKQKAIVSFEGEDCVTAGKLSRYYRLFRKYPHFCPNCGGKVKIRRKIEQVAEKCPVCGGILQAVPMLWD